MSDIRFDIDSLHAAYAAGLSRRRGHRRLCSPASRRRRSRHLHPSRRQGGAAWRRREALGAFDPVAKPLWGVPFAVKDNIDVAGMPTTAACPDYAYVPDKDATVVARLKAAGALVVGKTNLDQFATGLVGVRTPYPIPRNAIDPSLVPGGSSSGSAVATARGIVSFALGTDTAGSGRIPAGLNNIVGLKPTVGALSASGVVPACRTLDCVSIFALTVEDAYRGLQRCRRPRTPPIPIRKPVASPAACRAPAGAERRRPGQSRSEILRRHGDGRRLRGRAGRCWNRSAAGWSKSPSAISTPPPICSTKAPGWPSAMPRSRTSSMLTKRSLHPVTRQIIGGAREALGRRRLQGPLRAAGLQGEARAGHRLGRSVLRADRADALHGRGGARRSDRHQQPARHLHQFRQPARHVRHRRADGQARATACR